MRSATNSSVVSPWPSASFVKNSYDADATDVLLRFTGPLERGNGCIELMDNGHGMSPETLSTVFLEPGTPFRRNGKRSRDRNRRVLGEKGIGRFAVSRLADRMSVSTREPGARIEATLALAWTDFDDDAKYLDEIPIQWGVSPPTRFASGGTFDLLLEALGGARHTAPHHGTILRLEALRNDWTGADFTTLRNSLSRLVSPFASEARETFRIHLDFPGEYHPRSLGSFRHRTSCRVPTTTFPAAWTWTARTCWTHLCREAQTRERSPERPDPGVGTG